MISLEQIKLLEGKITKAIELIRILKEENTTLRRGLESAQKRMRELESLVDGFKADQKEIESVIVRTLHTLDELEESSAAKRQEREQASSPAAAPGGIPAAAPGGIPAAAATDTVSAAAPRGNATLSRPGAAAPGGIPAAAPSAPGGASGAHVSAAAVPNEASPAPTKEELDIF